MALKSLTQTGKLINDLANKRGCSQRILELNPRGKLGEPFGEMILEGDQGVEEHIMNYVNKMEIEEGEKEPNYLLPIF